MECGQLTNGLRWSAYTTSSDSNLPSILIDDALASGDEQCINDNYLITFPDDESDIDSAYDPKDRFEEVDSENESGKLPRCYENPLFIPRDLKTADWRDSGVQSEAARFGNYKFLNDFDIECEGEEAVPVVYLSCSRAARLQRSLRLAGYKKVSCNYRCKIKV